MIGGMQDWPLRIPRLIEHAEREHGAREIVSRWADGSTTRTTWAGVACDARRLANALRELGIGPRDRVATMAMNHSHHLATWYGVIGMGAIVHTMNPRLFDDQLAYIVEHAADRVLIYDAAFAPIVERMKPRWPAIEHYICFDPPADGASFENLIAPASDDFAWVEGDERDPIMLCYTSGTTGNPKGVLYEHRSTILHAMAEVAPDIFDLSARSVALPIVPMFHVAAWGLPFSAAMAGIKIVFSTDYRPHVLCELFNDEQVTHSAGVPTVWLGLIAHVEATGASLGPLAKVTIGGSAAPRAMIEWLTTRGIEVNHAWGMTETSPIGTSGARPAGWDRMAAAERTDFQVRQGRAPFGVEIRVVDDAGLKQPRDGASSGRLQIRGPWVIARYFGDESGPATDADGWFDTGDVAVIHPDGVMQITDRAKDVIKSGGEWISSIELENAAVGCDGVAEAAAIGIAHHKWDERPLLIVVRQAGSAVTPDAILEHLSGRVARWWLPDEIVFVDALPHTATGKLLKTALREQYRGHRLPTA